MQPEANQHRALRRPRALLQPLGQHPGDDVINDLLLGAGRGDHGAFAAFYDRTSSVVFGFLRGVLGESAEAERITKRAYLHLWRTAPQFDAADGSAYSLLLLTARRELVSHLHDILTHSQADQPGDEKTPASRD